MPEKTLKTLPMNGEELFIRTVVYPRDEDANGVPQRYEVIQERVPRPKNASEPSVERTLVATVEMQQGPTAVFGVTGLTENNLLEIALDRLRALQTTEYSCRENAIAITKIEEALMWQRKRKSDHPHEKRDTHGERIL